MISKWPRDVASGRAMSLQSRTDFFDRTVVIILIQDPAHKIKKLHLAMASCRVLMVLVRIYLYERQHARVYYLHGGVATRISGAGQSAFEGCPPAAMTRPMHTCNQGHRSRAQTVAALRQSMNELNTAVICKAISTWIPTSSRTVSAKRKNYSPLLHKYCTIIQERNT